MKKSHAVFCVEVSVKRGLRGLPNKIHFVLQNEYLAKNIGGFPAGHPASTTTRGENGSFFQETGEKSWWRIWKKKSGRESREKGRKARENDGFVRCPSKDHPEGK